MTHVANALAASHDDTSHPSGADAGPDHCGQCDLWNALGHVLVLPQTAVQAARPRHGYFISPARAIDTASVRWYMQRAPPHIA